MTTLRWDKAENDRLIREHGAERIEIEFLHHGSSPATAGRRFLAYFRPESAQRRAAYARESVQDLTPVAALPWSEFGLTARLLREAHGCCDSARRSRLLQSYLRHLEDGFSRDESRKKREARTQAISEIQRMQRVGRPWTPGDAAILRRVSGKRCDCRRLARTLDRPVEEVRRMCKWMALAERSPVNGRGGF